MPTIISDDPPWAASYPPATAFKQPTIRAQLAKGFDGEAEFYLCDGQPYVVWCNWDYAENWAAYPVKEDHPYHPILHGTRINEIEFRKVVCAMHCVSG